MRRLIIEDTSVYEIDEDCLRHKEQEKRENKNEKKDVQSYGQVGSDRYRFMQNKRSQL